MKRVMALILLLLPAAAWATANTTRGYHSISPVNSGTIVSLSKNATVVSPSTKATANSIIGVVAGPEGAVFATTEGPDDVQVTVEGVENVIVSTTEGDIKSGDTIGLGSLNGIGVKVSGGYSVGTAEGSLDAKSAAAQKVKLKDTAGKTVDVVIGVIPVLIEPANRPKSSGSASGTSGKNSNVISGFISSSAEGVAGKHVGLGVALLGMIIVLGSALVAMALVGSAVRATVISIGRNPLARRSIVKSTIQSVGLAAVVLLAGLVASFGVVRFL